MSTLAQDVRYAVRTLAKSPAFTALAVACLALGIGVNTTIFSVVNGVLLKPFPFADPDRIVALKEARPQSDIEHADPSYATFGDWQTQNTTFSQIAAFTFRSLTLTEGEEPERLEGQTVSWNLFPMLGVRPAIGRDFREDEDRPGAPGVTLLSDELWRRRFNGDSAVIGRTIMVNANPHTVVGVMPPGFKFPRNTQLWVPIAPIQSATPRAERGVAVYGRLKPAATLDQARAEMTAMAKRLEAQYPREQQGWSATVRPLGEELVGEDTRLIILTMMGAVSFVLLIACANVASLMLARAGARTREIAVRAALGAGRGRIVRQLLTESVLIALAGGALGVVIASWGLDLITAAIPPEDALPYFIQWSLDVPTLVYTLAVSVVTGIIFGLAPALQASKGNLHEALKEGGRGGSGGRRNRLRTGLVVAEVSLSLILLVGASLFVRSFMNIQGASGGFDSRPLMTMRFYMPGDGYEAASPKARRVADVVRRVEAVPGVEAAVASNMIPLSGGGDVGGVVVDGHPVAAGDEPRIFWAAVTPHLFRTLGVPILRGRDFTDAEGADSSGVAVISQKMAAKLWPNADPVGRRFRLASDTTAEWLTVIGVARDFYYTDLDADKKRLLPAAFLPYPYEATRNTGLTMRTSGDPARITAAARRAIRESDPILPVFEIATMERVRETGFWQFGLFSWMFGIFGAIALFLAAIGVYGVIAYGVSQRTREIGVRVALGASRGDVLGMVIRQGAVLAVWGVGLGLLGAFATTRVVRSQLYDVSATDPVSFAAVVVFLTGVALLASYIPARRATAVDPMEALRNE